MRHWILAVGLILFTARADAQLDLTFTPANEAGSPGETVTFSGTIHNSSGADLFLNGDNFLLQGNGLTLDDTKFFANTPPILTDGDTFSGELFDVAIASNAVPGRYSGSFSLLGGVSDADFTTLALKGFSVTVVPEPGAWGILMAGMVGAGLLPRRRRGC